MQECVIVPTYKRSEMLYCCLEAIRAVEPTIPIHVFPDRGTDETAICKKFNVIHHLTWSHTYHGNSANMLEALKWASTQKYDRVYIVEDDAIVNPTFFDWCRNALTMFPASFAACGWQYSPNAVIDPSPNAPDLVIPWYLSVCCCLPMKSVRSIVQHARPEYYSDMQGYLDRAYPNSFRRGSAHYEQDGLALRVCEAESKRCVWPRKPRALHVGFFGYHTGDNRLEGTLEERITVLKLAIKNPSALKSLMTGGPIPETAPCETCGKLLLTTNKNARVICRVCFHADHPESPVTTTETYYLKPLAPGPQLPA